MIEAHHEGKDAESNGIYFGSNRGHGHRDTMNLYLHGFGIDLMPDLGEPSFKDKNPERYRWSSNALSHNTVTVRQEKPFEEEIDYQEFPDCINAIAGGKVNHYYTDGKISLIEAETAKLYNRDFRRTVITVDIDGESRYLVDLFHVGKGERHISYHAIGTDTTESGAEFIPQGGGTYAGADVPYADVEYTKKWYDGFNYLTDVRRCEKTAGFTVDWKCVDNWHVWKNERNVHLKIHMLSEVDGAALCKGVPPQAHAGNPYEMTYLVAHKNGSAGDFVSVIEPYENESFILGCEIISACDSVSSLCITHKSGRRDYVVINRSDDAFEICGEKLSGFLNVRSFDKDGKPIHDASYGNKTITGRVCNFTTELCAENYITIKPREPVEATLLCGRFVDVKTDYEPNAFYEIKDAKNCGDGMVELSVGDCTFITGFVDRDNKEKGYTYSVEKGADFTIVM